MGEEVERRRFHAGEVAGGSHGGGGVGKNGGDGGCVPLSEGGRRPRGGGPRLGQKGRMGLRFAAEKGKREWVCRELWAEMKERNRSPF
jgi:hypothetical protein